jgi:hypothetical protein
MFIQGVILDPPPEQVTRQLNVVQAKALHGALTSGRSSVSGPIKHPLHGCRGDASSEFQSNTEWQRRFTAGQLRLQLY